MAAIQITSRDQSLCLQTKPIKSESLTGRQASGFSVQRVLRITGLWKVVRLKTQKVSNSYMLYYSKCVTVI